MYAYAIYFVKHKDWQLTIKKILSHITFLFWSKRHKSSVSKQTIICGSITLILVVASRGLDVTFTEGNKTYYDSYSVALHQIDMANVELMEQEELSY